MDDTVSSEFSSGISSSSTATGTTKKKVGPDDFVRIRLLGRGDVGKVYLVALKDTEPPVLFAMKILSKPEMIKRNKVRRVLTEREILATADHPFIVRLHYSFQSERHLYFVMDYCAGGMFLRVLQTQPERRLPEKAVRFYASEVLLALEYLHFIGFIYRDLKPENILMDESGHLKLTDFDLSKSSGAPIEAKMISSLLSKQPRIQAQPMFVTNSFVGTAEYLAPEVIEGCGHSASVDWWAFGILIFEMLYGKTPFRGRSQKETFSNIEAVSDTPLHVPEYPPTTREVKDLLKSLVNPDPSQRLGASGGASEVKEHPWFKSINWALIRNQEPPIVPAFKNSLDTRHFRPLKDDGTATDDVGLDDVALDVDQLVSTNPFAEFTSISRGPDRPGKMSSSELVTSSSSLVESASVKQPTADAKPHRHKSHSKSTSTLPNVHSARRHHHRSKSNLKSDSAEVSPQLVPCSTKPKCTKSSGMIEKKSAAASGMAQ